MHDDAKRIPTNSTGSHTGGGEAPPKRALSARLAILAAMARADGIVHENEKTLLNDACASLGLPPQEVTDALSNPLHVAKGDLPQSKEDRRLLLVEALEMASVDGQIGEAERQLLLKVARILGFSPLEAGEIVREVRRNKGNQKQAASIPPSSVEGAENKKHNESSPQRTDSSPVSQVDVSSTSQRQIKKRFGVFGGYIIHYACPRCSTSLTSPLDDAGNDDMCPNCASQFTVPGLDERNRIRDRHRLEVEKRARHKEELRGQKGTERRERERQTDIQKREAQGTTSHTSTNRSETVFSISTALMTILNCDASRQCSTLNSEQLHALGPPYLHPGLNDYSILINTLDTQNAEIKTSRFADAVFETVLVCEYLIQRTLERQHKKAIDSQEIADAWFHKASSYYSIASCLDGETFCHSSCGVSLRAAQNCIETALKEPAFIQPIFFQLRDTILEAGRFWTQPTLSYNFLGPMEQMRAELSPDVITKIRQALKSL
jgi:uncharacterized tellurite resistance protein B-like protein